MSKNCNHPTCMDSELCRREKKPKKIHVIRKQGKKLKKAMVDYNKEREVFLEDNPACEVCGGVASQVHHKRGRIGQDLLDKRYWLAVCPNCHRWIEEHSEVARELGYSESRLNKR